MNKTKFIEWRPPIQKWHKVDSETYEIIYVQAKERLEDVLSESESITDKSIKMITALAALLGTFVGFVIQQKLQLGYYSFFLIPVLVDVFLLFILLAPKEIKNRGISPKVSIPIDLDSDEKQYHAALVYYQSIIVLQDNIDFMIDKNIKRAKLYQWSLGLFLLIFTTVSTFLVASL